MQKVLTIVYTAFFFASPFLATFIALTIGRKFNLFKIPRSYPLYVLLLGFAYYGAFFFGEYIIPILNRYLYSMDAKAMGPAGLLQDYCLPLLFAVPAYTLINKAFNVSNGKGKYFPNFFLYYSLNFALFLLALEPFTHYIY